MIPILLKRFIFLLISGILSFATCNSLVSLLPGDPIEILIEETGTSVSKEWLNQELHLDQPIFKRISYGFYQAIHMNWGKSIISQEEIGPQLKVRTKQSILLASTVFIISIAITILIGPLSAVHEFHNRMGLSRLISIWGWLSASLSTVWIGPVFLVLFTYFIPIADAAGSFPLASLTLIFLFTGGALRLTRERVRESVRSGPVRGAIARGFPEKYSALFYGFFPISGVLFSYFGSQFGSLMAGAFVTEVIFGLPGLGSYLVKAILMRDFTTIQAALFFSTILCLTGTFLGDLAHTMIDPRNRATQ